MGISFAGISEEVVLDNVYSCFNDNLDIDTGRIPPPREPIAARPFLDTCVEATGQIFVGTTDGEAQVCPTDPNTLFRPLGSIAGVINSLDENGDGPITSCDDLFAQQGILFENDGTRAPTPAVPDPFITDEGEPCVSSRAEDINPGCDGIPGAPGSFGTISFGETIQGTTSTFFDGDNQVPGSDSDQFKFFHRGGSISATLETSFGCALRCYHPLLLQGQVALEAMA